MVTGINHITLSVRNANASFSFYTDVLGFKPIARWRTGSYLLAGDTWIALYYDRDIHNRPLQEYSHIAFSVDKSDFLNLKEKIRLSGTRIWQENRTEGESCYFLDPDGHKLEIHASSLQERIENMKKNPWDEIEYYD